MVLVIAIILLVLAIIQMVIYYRYGINILKPMVTRQFLSHASSLGYTPHKQPRVMP